MTKTVVLDPTTNVWDWVVLWHLGCFLGQLDNWALFSKGHVLHFCKHPDYPTVYGLIAPDDHWRYNEDSEVTCQECMSVVPRRLMIQWAGLNPNG